MRQLSIALLLMTLAACAARPTAPATAPGAAQRAPALSAHGVGGIDVDTPFDQAALDAALPGLRFTLGEVYSEDQPVPALIANRAGEPVLTVIASAGGERIDSVLIEAGPVHNALGHASASRLGDIYADASPCRALVEQYAGEVLCRAPGAANVFYLFVGDWNGPDGELPPWPMLRDWTLARFVWRPPTR